MRAVNLLPPEPTYDGLGVLAAAFGVALVLFVIVAAYVAWSVGWL